MLQIVARLLGWQPHPDGSDAAPLAALAAAPPPGLTIARAGNLGLPPPLLDAAALRARNRTRALAIARRNAPRLDG
jgi:hypothetical protein